MISVLRDINRPLLMVDATWCSVCLTSYDLTVFVPIPRHESLSNLCERRLPFISAGPAANRARNQNLSNYIRQRLFYPRIGLMV
jgi:hypothetical protein